MKTWAVGAALAVESTSLGALIAQAGGSDLGGPWVLGSTASMSVAALAFIARLMATGGLVPRSSAEAEARLTKLVEGYEEKLRQSHEREATYLALLVGNRKEAER